MFLLSLIKCHLYAVGALHALELFPPSEFKHIQIFSYLSNKHIKQQLSEAFANVKICLFHKFDLSCPLRNKPHSK